jgi:hypothetical protein
MPSMSEFLSGFAYNGAPVVQTGTIDVGSGMWGGAEQIFSDKYPDWEDTGPQSQAWKNGKMKGIHQWMKNKGFGGSTKDDMGLGSEGIVANDFDNSDVPQAYARLLQGAEMEGGVLSGTMQNQEFAEQTSGLMSLSGAQDRDRARSFAKNNISGVFADRMGDNSQFEMGNTLGGLKAGQGAQHAADLFNAKKGFTDMITQTSTAEKQFKVNTAAALAGAEQAADASKNAGMMQGAGSLLGAATTVAGIAAFA